MSHLENSELTVPNMMSPDEWPKFTWLWLALGFAVRYAVRSSEDMQRRNDGRPAEMTGSRTPSAHAHHKWILSLFGFRAVEDSARFLQRIGGILTMSADK